MLSASYLNYPLKSIRDVLQISSLTKQFGTRRVLNGISLTLQQREVLALCGPSGSGKTTLLRIICGLIPFDAGQLLVGKTEIPANEPYPTDLYGKIGLIFQDHNLFPHMTVIGNVILALREVKRLPSGEARERGMTELERMGVASLAQRYPSTLSGGERQRVAIARAVALDPLLLLLDEPTAQLDPDRIQDVRDRVLKLADTGMTMLLITHNMGLARQVGNSFALLQDGTCYVSDSPTILDSLTKRKQ
jgi:ABC-type polar amino acid transport system ATPase subunit